MVSVHIGKNQLDIYLDEPTLVIPFTEPLDALEWWKSNSQRLSYLPIMARDLLNILITTVAYESDFNTGSRILNKYKSRLLSKHVEAIICTCSWKHRFR